MNDRERWKRTMHFQNVDHVVDMECGFWPETLTAWHQQGLPLEVSDAYAAARYFGLWRLNQELVAVNLGLWPPFERKLLHEDGRYQTIVDRDGVVCRIYSDGSSTVPEHLKFPVERCEDWAVLERRLDPQDPARYPSNWEELKGRWRTRTCPMGIYLGGFFGWARKWMGVTRLCTAFVDEPSLVHRIMRHLAEFIAAAIEKAVCEVELDFVLFWEDMCFRGGPLISPGMFKAFLSPCYRHVTDLLRRNGIDVVIVDCDGDIAKLVPLWLEAGVNTMFPLQIRNGTDVFALRRQYGKDLLLCGGVDKTRLSGQSCDRRRNERMRLVAMGGYIPHLDHLVPPDITLDNFEYYLKIKRQAMGISQGARPNPLTAMKASAVQPRDFIRTDEAGD